MTRLSGRISARAAFFLQASIIVVFLMSSATTTPLYATWQEEWGFSSIAVTVIFSTYGLGMLVALLTVGSLSDHVGRRPVLLVTVAGQALAMVLFLVADGVPVLLAARVLQGLASGGALGALGAGLLDIDKRRGAVANAVAPPLGTAVGGLGTGLLVQFLPDPTHLVYFILLGIILAQGVGVVLMRESVTKAPGALASIRPWFSLPPATRGPMLVAVPALVSTWAMAGFYGAIGPALLHLIAGNQSAVLAGLPLFLFAGSGSAAVGLLRTTPADRVRWIAATALIVGVSLTLLGMETRSIALILIGVAIGGIGYGAGFHGVVRTVAPLAAPHERAGVIAVIYLVAYLAMSLPAVIGGFLIVYGGGVLTTAREYGLAVLALGILAVAGMLWQGRRVPVRAYPSA